MKTPPHPCLSHNYTVTPAARQNQGLYAIGGQRGELLVYFSIFLKLLKTFFFLITLSVKPTILVSKLRTIVSHLESLENVLYIVLKLQRDWDFDLANYKYVESMEP